MGARRLKRDTVLFALGVAGVAYETLSHGPERPTLLLLFAAMIGLPAFLRGDEHNRGSDREIQDAPPKP